MLQHRAAAGAVAPAQRQRLAVVGLPWSAAWGGCGSHPDAPSRPWGCPGEGSDLPAGLQRWQWWVQIRA